MKKYINAKQLIEEINERLAFYLGTAQSLKDTNAIDGFNEALEIIDSLQQEQPAHMIQWTGSNLQEVIDFTGKSPKFGEWFKSWDEFESYVHSHGDILKLFSEDGSHFEVPVGAWIVKTPDGYNVPSVARFIHAKQEHPEVDVEKEYKKWWDSIKSKINIEHVMEWYMHETARHFAEWGAIHLNVRKEE